MRIFAHAQVVEDQAHVARELSRFLLEAACASSFDHADSERAKPGRVFQAVAGTDTTAVPIIVPIENVVASIVQWSRLTWRTRADWLVQRGW